MPSAALQETDTRGEVTRVGQSPVPCIASFAEDSYLAPDIFCYPLQVFPLWCITPWELGGLEVGTNQIAFSQITSGIALVHPPSLFRFLPKPNLIQRLPLPPMPLLARYSFLYLCFSTDPPPALRVRPPL